MLQHALQQQHRCETPPILVSMEKYLTRIDHLHHTLDDKENADCKDGACTPVHVAWQSILQLTMTNNCQ